MQIRSTLSTLAAVSMSLTPAIATAQTAANPASSLSVARTGTAATEDGSSMLSGAGGGGLIALGILAGIIAIGVIAIINDNEDDDTPRSP